MPLAKTKPAAKSLNVRAPNRVSHTYKQRLNGSLSKVFPLLCPVREADWIHGWNPVVVLTQSGYAEQDCVFITDAKVHDAIWYVTRHDPARGFVEMIKITPGVTACKLTIRVRPVEARLRGRGHLQPHQPRPGGRRLHLLLHCRVLRAVHA